MMLKEPLQSSHLNLYNTFYNMFQSSFTLIIIHSTKIIANKKIFKKKHRINTESALLRILRYAYLNGQ